MVQRSALCRSRRELSNEHLLGKFGFDTSGKEPCKVCPFSVYRSPRWTDNSGLTSAWSRRDGTSFVGVSRRVRSATQMMNSRPFFASTSRGRLESRCGDVRPTNGLPRWADTQISRGCDCDIDKRAVRSQ